MKYLIPVLLAVLLVNCSQPVPKAEKPQKIVSSSKTTPLNYVRLIDAYVPLNFDTLKVFSSYNLDSIGYKYRGVQLDSASITLLGGNINHHGEYFANFRFDIDERRLGLISRIPSDYEPSSITLFVYNKIRKEITGQFELALNWGDGAELLEKTSWLYKDEKGRLNCLLWQSFYTEYSSDPNKDTSITKNNYYLVNLHHSVTDTVDRNAKALFKKMKQLR